MAEESTSRVGSFAMPKPVRITARSSSITNSFVNGIIPVIYPTTEEVREALATLGMLDHVVCAYCGDPSTEWDHLRPLVENQRPTGYISEIHNLVPACGKCNQSKGNRHWKSWMRSNARLSPATRGVADIEDRIARLEEYERQNRPTRIDFGDAAGAELWARHWEHHLRILAMMREADADAQEIKARVRAAYDGQPSNDSAATPHPYESAESATTRTRVSGINDRKLSGSSE